MKSETMPLGRRWMPRTAVVACVTGFASLCVAEPLAGTFTVTERLSGAFAFLQYQIDTPDGRTRIDASGNAAIESFIGVDPVASDMVASNLTFSGSFAYDTAAVPSVSFPEFATYSNGNYKVTLNVPGQGDQNLTFSPAEFSVFDSTTTPDRVSLGTGFLDASTSPLVLSQEGSLIGTVDLLTDSNFEQDAPARPAGLTQLLVRISRATTVYLESPDLSLEAVDASVISGTGLPQSFALSEYSQTESVGFLQFKSTPLYEVNADDYLSFDEYLLALDYVTANDLEFTLKTIGNYDLTALESSIVPEPGAALIAAIACVLPLRRRRV